MIPEEYVCDLCGIRFPSLEHQERLLPELRKQPGQEGNRQFNQLSDEDVYVGILSGREKTSFLF